MTTAMFWKWENGNIRCELCPHRCLIRPGEVGLCGVRKHIPEIGLESLNSGRFSSVAIDPIEKKPLYHWRPTSKILSLGSVGCNMICPFCQNWPIARWESGISLNTLTEQDILDLSHEHRSHAVAFTYNEPLVEYEFLLSAAKKLKKANIAVVLVTNGMISPSPLNKLLPFISAANIDLKAFTENIYRDLGGDLETVKGTIKTMFERRIHVELTHLVVSDLNDDRRMFQDMIRWIVSISPQIVLHLSRYFPSYKWHAPSTRVKLLEEWKKIAEKYLYYVYLGNVPRPSVTRCRNCGNPLITRDGYSVNVKGMDASGRCRVCRAKSDIEM